MAEAVTIRAALERIGFSQAAAAYLTDNQGMNELIVFTELSDSEVDQLCKIVRKDGNNGNGIEVSMIATNHLKLMCYFLRFKNESLRRMW
jgi:hypothetical protein